MFVKVLYLLFTEAKGSTSCSQEPAFLPILQWQAESGPGRCTLLLQKALLILLNVLLQATPRPVGFSFRFSQTGYLFSHFAMHSACLPDLSFSSEDCMFWSNLVSQ